MSRFPRHLQQLSRHRSPRCAWMVVLLAVLTLFVGTLTGVAAAAEASAAFHVGAAHPALTVATAAASATAVTSSPAGASEQAPEQGEYPSEGDSNNNSNNMEDERDNLVFLLPSPLSDSVVNGLLTSHSDLLLPRSTEPRGIDKPPRF